jgi:agmatine deiminase
MRILLCLLVLALSSLCSRADEAQLWQQAEAEARGDFPRLLALVDAAPIRPQLRQMRSVAEHVQVLAAAGRFQALGVSPAQGEALVRAWYRRQGLDTAGRKPDTAPTTPTVQPTAAQPPAGWRAGREFDPLQAVLLRWPFDWAALRDEYATLVQTIVEAGADARIWVDNERQRRAAQRALQDRGVPLQRVQWTVEATNTVWLRDYGPNFVYGNTGGDGDWGVVDFHYYDQRPQDDDTPQVVAAGAGKTVVDRQQGAQRVYTEGGNLNTDGLGAVIYSERTYARNPGVPRASIDERIASAFNATRRIVLKDPSLDATGHVDMFSKLVDTRTVLVAQYDADEVDHATLEANAATLAAASNGAGEPLNVVRIRQPDVYYEGLVNPVVRTYTNSLIVNDRVIVPVYGIADDAAALALYATLFPGKTIVPLNARQIITSAGAWHCVTMEFPAP